MSESNSPPTKPSACREIVAEDQEVIVMLRLKFKPGAIDHVLSEIAPSAMLTREETGNIEFHIFRARDHDDQLVIFERWKSQSSLSQHWPQDYTKRVLVLFEEHLIRPLSPTEDVTYLSDAMRAAR